jgi:hypothetical protein
LQRHTFEKVAAIEGLDVESGLKWTGGKIKSYLAVLRQFCGNSKELSRNLKGAMEKANWKEYAIKAHAYKGIFAIISHDALFTWSKRLEYAASFLAGELDKGMMGKPEDVDFIPADGESAKRICEEETSGYIKSIDALHKALSAAPLGEAESWEKKKIAKGDLAVLLEALAESCRRCSPKEAERDVLSLQGVSCDKKTDAVVKEIIRLVNIIDYEQALVKIRGLEKTTAP